MNFFNMGPGELIFILVLALLIFGPRRLPELARDLGKAVRSFQQASQQLTGELTKEMEQATKAMDEAQQSVTGTVSEVITAAGTELTAAGAAATTELKEAAATVNEGLQGAAAAAVETPFATDAETPPVTVSVTPDAPQSEPAPVWEAAAPATSAGFPETPGPADAAPEVSPSSGRENAGTEPTPGDGTYTI
jgi:sec-independent protein translocase protein TatA